MRVPGKSYLIDLTTKIGIECFTRCSTHRPLNCLARLRRASAFVTRHVRGTRSSVGDGSPRRFEGREKQGETYTSSGICQDGKSPAFWAKQNSESPESLSRSIALRCPCSAQARGSHPCLPVERMRSTQGMGSRRSGSRVSVPAFGIATRNPFQ
jgi:hypothetical protein